MLVVMPSDRPDRMDRRRFLEGSAALLGASPLTGSSWPGRRTRREERPDVLLLIGGDFGWRDIDPHVHTPSIARFMEQGMTFTKAFSYPAGGLTCYTLHFGRHPRRDGIVSTPLYYASTDEPAPDPGLLSLAGLFKRAGYSTGLFGKWNLGRLPDIRRALTPNHFGFDTWAAGVPGIVVQGGGTGYRDWLRVDDGEERMDDSYQTLAMQSAWERWWKRTEGPRFAVCAFHVAHQPFHNPPSKLLPPRPRGDRALISQTLAMRTRMRVMYEDMIGSLDTVIGQILEVASDDTRVVLVSDNGTPVRAAARDQNPKKIKHTTFDGGINVPLIVRGPGIRPGRSEALISTVDVYGTVADLAGLEVPPGAAEDSRSFLEVIHAPRRSTREHVYAEANDLEFVVRTDTHKLRRLRNKLELYDLVADPEEDRPLDRRKPANAAIAEPLLKILRNPLG